jgi:hypothetical protein
MRILGIAGLCVALGGCIGPLVPVTHVDDTTAVELDQTVRTFEARDTPSRSPVLGPITATSCKNKIWDKDATAEDATNQLRLGSIACDNPSPAVCFIERRYQNRNLQLPRPLRSHPPAYRDGAEAEGEIGERFAG